MSEDLYDIDAQRGCEMLEAEGYFESNPEARREALARIADLVEQSRLEKLQRLGRIAAALKQRPAA